MKNLFFWASMLFTIPLFGQMPSRSIKVFLKDTLQYSLGVDNEWGFVRLYKNSLNKKEETHNQSGYHLNIQHRGKFAYNPIAWLLDDNLHLTIIGQSSIDGLWTNVTIGKTFSDFTKSPHKDFGLTDFEYLGGPSNPLFLQMFTWTSATADIEHPLYFDLDKPDSLHLRLFIYTKRHQRLEVWSFAMNQDSSVFRDTMMSEAFRRYWKNEANYSLSLDGYFSALTCQGKTYIATQDGTLYRLGRTTEFVRSLPDRLDKGTLVINKDTDEVHYLSAKALRKKRSLAESLQKAGKRVLPE